MSPPLRYRDAPDVEDSFAEPSVKTALEELDRVGTVQKNKNVLICYTQIYQYQYSQITGTSRDSDKREETVLSERLHMSQDLLMPAYCVSRYVWWPIRDP